MMNLFKYILVAFIFIGQNIGHTQALPEEERAKIIRLYLRLTGTLPSAQVTDSYLTTLRNQGLGKVGELIIQNQSEFLDVTVKDFVTPFTNQNADHTNALNDMSATMIGMIRDDIPFNQIFYRDILYLFKGTMIASFNRDELLQALDNGRQPLNLLNYLESSNAGSHLNWNTQATLDPEPRLDRLLNTFSLNDSILIKDPRFPNLRFVIHRFYSDRNNHYLHAEALSLSFANPAFSRVSQGDYLHGDERAIAGVMSTRGFGHAYLNAGTNRAAVAYMMEHFMCKTMFQMKDGTISDEFITRDIPRVPGGKESTYKNDCMTCHTGLDPQTNAFAYHDYDGQRLIYNFNQPAAKLNNVISNDDVTVGHKVESDYWVNFWRTGLNSYMNWGPAASGSGIKSLGEMYAATAEFPKCMSKRVLEKVCFNRTKTAGGGEASLINHLSQSFVSNNYNMKKLFIETAVKCQEIYD